MTSTVSVSDLGQLYLEVHHRLHRQIDEAMTGAGVSLSRAKVLRELAEHGAMKQAELASRLGLAARSVTDTVDGLEREGLATRRSDPLDRRARLVEMTPAGAIALEQAMAVKQLALERIFGALDTAARAEFAAALVSMRDRLVGVQLTV